jgi:lysophospholipase L1-like esterase
VLVAQSIPVVDLMCDPKSYDRANYSSDGFHPNDAGYSNMATQFVKAITTSGYPAPKSSCAQMSLVPAM